ncbi:MULTISPECIES: LysR family transcriptional regulator [Cupriavidus]|uniref:LysR family nitrogen assimilation transcriptional regulator n=2 Tax=Cupriavidus TaxID=106589 RepID=A0A7W4YSR1_9BURK|nr:MULTISPECIES: LysR family transcriptional regulator [Cupriavidus]MBB3009898.1 LysR family nitrogen assimilation transcriptional regulator [Cupriavidus alkaliphilus]QBY56227.1 LysR family transcriptional regulator [Cupriavidus oxalaticus]
MKLETELDLADLRAVLAVSDTASYTRAAQKLGITQPAISRRINALEQSLNARLFRREGGGFVLTEAGTAFCERATQVLELMEQLPQATSQAASSPRGTVAIGVPPTTGEILIQHLIPEYRSAYPGVFVRIEQGYVNDLFDMLMDKQIDIALLNGPFNPSAVDLEPLFHHHLGIVYPIAWKESSPLDGNPMPQSLTLAQVAQLPLLAASQNQSIRHLVDSEFRAAGLKPNVVMEVNSFVLQRSLVSVGVGCMFMSRTVVRDEHCEKLAFVPISDSKIIYTLYLATRRAGQPTLAAKLMGRMIRKSMERVVDWLNAPLGE